MGATLVAPEGATVVEGLAKKAKEKHAELACPVDYVTGDQFGADAKPGAATDESGVPDGVEGFDAGPKSRELFAAAIKKSKTIVWNGPVGVFEFEIFAEGTKAVAQAVVEATQAGATTIIGGGDTATAAKKNKIVDKVSHCSTGGGASLELLEGKNLPGVAALSDK